MEQRAITMDSSTNEMTWGPSFTINLYVDEEIWA